MQIPNLDGLKLNLMVKLLFYNTIQSSYLTEPWEIAHSIGFTHDKMVIFHSKLWISQTISFCIPLYPIKSRKKSPKSGEKMSILSFKSTKNWWRYVNMSILSQQKCLWPLPPIVSVSTSQGFQRPKAHQLHQLHLPLQRGQEALRLQMLVLDERAKMSGTMGYNGDLMAYIYIYICDL